VQRVVIGHAAVYNNIGRTEVQPFPTDPEANVTGIRYRYSAFPLLEPATARGYGFLRFRYPDPDMEDNIWVYNPGARRVAGVRADQSGAKGTATIDPDSSFGFAAKYGALWKTVALFTAYRDRSALDARVAIYPFRRIFQTAVVDEDIQNGFSTISYTPGHETRNSEGWYINMVAVKRDFLDPNEMSFIGH
jgi:uncharacterized protein DUF1329